MTVSHWQHAMNADHTTYLLSVLKFDHRQRLPAMFSA